MDIEDILGRDPTNGTSTRLLAISPPPSLIADGEVWDCVTVTPWHGRHSSSGIFLNADDKSDQEAGEQTIMRPKSPLGDSTAEPIMGEDHIKATTMAHIYYRESGSQGDEQHLMEAKKKPRHRHKRSSTAAALGKNDAS